MTNRQQLIQQLRHALYLAESPHTEVAEFEIGPSPYEVGFSVSLEDEENDDVHDD